MNYSVVSRSDDVTASYIECEKHLLPKLLMCYVCPDLHGIFYFLFTSHLICVNLGILDICKQEDLERNFSSVTSYHKQYLVADKKCVTGEQELMTVVTRALTQMQAFIRCSGLNWQ